MKKLLILIGFMAGFNYSYGQYALSNGGTQLNLGFGFSDYGMPVYAGFDHGVSRDISVGGELSFRSYTDDYRDINYNLNVVGISANGNYHFNRVLNIPREWDLYAGLNIGFYIWNDPAGYGGDHTTGLGLGAQVGARYYFTHRFGINLEFGGGNEFAGGKFGITLRL